MKRDWAWRRRIAVIWQFDQLGERSVNAIAETCKRSGIAGVIFKAADGLAFPTQFRNPDLSPLAIASVSDVAERVEQFRRAGLRAGAWVNVTRWQWAQQGILHGEIAEACGWLALDLEPYDEFLGVYPPVDGVESYLESLIGTGSRRRGDDWCLAMMPDPRLERLAELRWELWGWRATCVYPQVYWTDFHRPVMGVLDDALAAVVHHDVRALLPYNGVEDFPAALAHPICRNGAGLWRMGVADEAALSAFGRRRRRR